MKLQTADGTRLNPEDSPEIPYKYHEISPFDLGCGTYNLSDWQVRPEAGNGGAGDLCPRFFVCTTQLSNYGSCVEAMNCHMMASMTTTAEGGSNSALFAHQMIPHHQNAVNMAKALLYAHPDALECSTSGPVEEGDVQPWACDLSTILYSIVNEQNAQIMDLRSVLSQLGVSEFANCDVSFGGIDFSKRNLQTTNEESPSSSTTTQSNEESGSTKTLTAVDCEPCVGTSGECEVKLKVDLFASELGYYEVEGCVGVNPTLHLTVGRTYKFDQTDISNWYHLIGFAYFPDGAHVGVDELEPGIPPGNSTCAGDLSCPAPMYFMNGEYQGEYSNIPGLVGIPETPSDDFGLSAVEPLFFHPIGDWVGYGPMVTYLNFDQNYNKDIFYFCHVSECRCQF